MVNEGHDFVYVLYYMISPKVRYAGTTIATQKSFAVKEKTRAQKNLECLWSDLSGRVPV
jgi:hypothetical protein